MLRSVAMREAVQSAVSEERRVKDQDGTSVSAPSPLVT